MKTIENQLKDWERIKRLCNVAKHPSLQAREIARKKLYDAIRNYRDAYNCEFNYSQRPRESKR